MEVILKITKRKILMLGIAVALFISFSTAYAATIPSGTSGTITVSAAPGLILASANLNGTSCAIPSGWEDCETIKKSGTSEIGDVEE